jgi:hypothetical protein
MWTDYIRWSRVFLGIGCDPRVYGRALDFTAACGSTVPILIRRVIQRNRDPGRLFVQGESSNRARLFDSGRLCSPRHEIHADLRGESCI